VSWRASAWVKLCRLGSVYRKAVLLVVADFASDKLGPDGGTVPEGHAVCWAGLAEVAAAAEVDERTVRRVLRDMEAATVVRRERRHDREGHRTTDAIWIHYGRMPLDLGDIAESARAAPVDDSPTGLPGTRLPDSQVPPTGLSYVPAEPSVNNLGNQEDHLLYVTTDRASREDDDDFATSYAAAAAELRRLPDFGLALIEDVRKALPGEPDYQTLVITAGGIVRERRRSA
jgi:hypothetical protein